MSEGAGTKPARPPAPEIGTPDEPEQQPPVSRLNSITEKVSDVTDRTKKFIRKDKLATPATKSTLDGVLIDRRLTEPSGILYKAKMIGSLSVQFHKGDKMAIEAMRDLKVMAKTSGRHKARIFLRISIQGMHILEDGTMKQIDIHDLDRISYLAEDPDDRKVFAYIYNKQIRNKDTNKTTTVHRLFAIKSPKCGLIVSNMKAVFHYMHDMRMSDNKPNTSNVDVSLAKRQAEEEVKSEEEAVVVVEAEGTDTLGFDYGKLVDFAEPEDLIQPVVPADPELFPEFAEEQCTSALDPGPAVNVYVTSPRGNRLALPDEEPVYSTVRKIKIEEPVIAPSAPRIEVSTCDFGTVNPAWNKSEANSIDEDIFSLDKYNRQDSSSSSSEEEHTFGVEVAAPVIPSAVFLEDYEWDIGADTTKRYNDIGPVEMVESRERLSTVTKKAVASLEKVRDGHANHANQPANHANQPATSSLIDFATFEDRLETDNAVDLFDTLKEKTTTSTTAPTPQTNELLSLDFAGLGPISKPVTLTVQPTVETQKYNIDINSLLSDPNTYKTTSTVSTGWVGFSPTSTANTTNTLSGAPVAFSGFGGSSGNLSGGSGTSTPNYQPTYNFPVSFGGPSDNLVQPSPKERKKSATNPFKQPDNKQSSNDFDPFGDLLNDAI